MKLVSFLTLASLAVSAAFAQSIEIGYPHHHTHIKPGNNLTVQVERPVRYLPTTVVFGSVLKQRIHWQDTLTPSQEVAIVISLLQCPKKGRCPKPSDVLGTILYAGPYNPQFPTFQTPHNHPQQNFTVTVPSSFTAHRIARLAVSHLTLVGVSGIP
jgi:hypothetical protein